MLGGRVPSARSPTGLYSTNWPAAPLLSLHLRKDSRRKRAAAQLLLWNAARGYRRCEEVV